MSNENFLIPSDREFEEEIEDDERFQNDQEKSEIADFSKKGYQLLRENRTNEAIEYFTRILTVEKDNNYALVGMGDANRKQGIFRNAVFFYQRCLSYHPGNNYALFGLADCYKALHQYHKAIELWQQYLIHDDKNITVLTRVADAYRKVRDYARSKEVYLKVLKMDVQNPYALIGLGHLLYDFKEYHGALHYWEKMLEENKASVDIRVLTSIGNCHRKLKSYEQGLRFFEMALQQESQNFYALFGLADCYRGLHQHLRSLEYWNQILNQDPRNKLILTRAADAYRKIGESDKAIDYYNRALNVEFDSYAVLGLAIVDKEQGKYDEAILSLERLIQQDPRNYRFYLELADCRLANQEKQKAVEVLREFLNHGIHNSEITGLLEKLSA